MASMARKALVSVGKNPLPRVEKKNALSPKPARGKAVAVPRWRGQLSAEVLTAAAKAMHAPCPVKNEKKKKAPTVPVALSYA